MENQTENKIENEMEIGGGGGGGGDAKGLDRDPSLQIVPSVGP